MHTRKRSLALILIIGLSLTACQPSTLISSLGAVISAAEVALPVIAVATGVPPPVIMAISGYLQGVDAAVMQASTILAGPGTSAQKSADIVLAFTGIAAGCNCIPAGTPTAVVSVIDAVAKAVARFLLHFTSAPPMTGAVAKVTVIKVSRTDKDALASIRERAEKHLVQVKAVTTK